MTNIIARLNRDVVYDSTTKAVNQRGQYASTMPFIRIDVKEFFDQHNVGYSPSPTVSLLIHEEIYVDIVFPDQETYLLFKMRFL